jgi:N-acyl-D-amino-acid deacylase
VKRCRCSLVLVTLVLVACDGERAAAPAAAPAAAQPGPPAVRYDVLVRNGTIYDGTGKPGFRGDVAINGDTVAAVGELGNATAGLVIDATDLAVAPGFINMLSQADESLIADGRAESDVRQGVTLEILGERSMGPLSDLLKQERKRRQTAIQYDIGWTTLGEYLEWLERRGVSVNVASFVGTGTVRKAVLGKSAGPPTPEQLDEMRALVAQAMEEGALGLTSALIYLPDSRMTTEELVELAKVAAQRGGIYTAHMRSEGNRIGDAVDEMLTIAREAGIPVEIYHFKVAGKPNWPKLDAMIQKIEAARAEGLRVTANMYPYTGAATSLASSVPAWARAGSKKVWTARMKSRKSRAKLRAQLADPSVSWENLYALAGPENVKLVGFRNPALRSLIGRTVAEIAAERGVSPEDAALDLLIEDDMGIWSIYFLMSEENVRRQLALPWMSISSDAPAIAPSEPFISNSEHPRAYGTFARVLGHYVREERALSLEEAIRRLTSLPAENLGLASRGLIAPDKVADIVVFDPRKITDHATYDRPHQLATGVLHVLVNGTPVLKDGDHTGAKPGRAVRGRAWKPPAHPAPEAAR